MKLGCDHKFRAPLDTLEELKAWYCNPAPQELVLNTASVLTSFVKGKRTLESLHEVSTQHTIKKKREVKENYYRSIFPLSCIVGRRIFFFIFVMFSPHVTLNVNGSRIRRTLWNIPA